MGKPRRTEASVGGEAALRRVAEAPQGSLGQGGGEGHQAESGGSPRERRHRRQWAALGTDFKI